MLVFLCVWFSGTVLEDPWVGTGWVEWVWRGWLKGGGRITFFREGQGERGAGGGW